MEVVGVEETGVRGHLYLAAYSAVRNEGRHGAHVFLDTDDASPAPLSSPRVLY